MRFKTGVKNIQTFTKFASSLSALGKVAWVNLNDELVRFTVIPETGTQVWASLAIDSVFEDYAIQSAADKNTINLELPLPPLCSALKSAINATSASLRLTKKNGVPLLCLTIITHTPGPAAPSLPGGFTGTEASGELGDLAFHEEALEAHHAGTDHETVVTQDIPVRVLSAASVEGIHEPRVREPDAHVLLPPLGQLKAISDRFTRLARATGSGSGGRAATMGLLGPGNTSIGAASPKLELSANMHGNLKLSIATDALDISSTWSGLHNPELDPSQIEGGSQGLADHPSSRLKAAGPDMWATVRIDGADWGRVLSVGRMGGRVIACFVDDHALILYVYLSTYDDGADESVLTYYISSYTV